MSAIDRARPPAQCRRPKKDGDDQAIGRSRGGLTTKIHAVTDALGNPIALSITPGQAADITQAEPLLGEIDAGAVLADKGYDSDRLVAALDARGITPVIPPKANRKEPRKTDFALYRERNLVEQGFGLRDIGGLPRRDRQRDRIAEGVGDSVDLRCQAAA